jgi:hypothetical protein
MLDLTHRVATADALGCAAYADSSIAGGFYVVPTVAGLALDDDGRPLLQLVVHGARTATGLRPQGALLTLTTSIGLHRSTLDALQSLLARHVAASWQREHEEAPRPTILALDWIDATVEVRVIDGISLSGQPSMLADNRCAFSRSFGAEEARLLTAAWSHGLPQGRVTYEGHVRTVGTPITSSSESSSVSITVETTAPDGSRRIERSDAATARTRRQTTGGAGHSLFVSASGSIAESVPDLAATLHALA